MLTIDIIGLSELQARLLAMPDAVRTALFSKSQELAGALAAKVGDNLSSQMLQSKTGRLKDSIQSSTVQNGDVITASVFAGGDVPYAAIQEYGGTTKAHVIEATSGKALAFNWQGKAAFFTRINHPGSVIPGHAYLRNALADMQDDIVEGMGEALREGMSE